jgi:hypothetical protein
MEIKKLLFLKAIIISLPYVGDGKSRGTLKFFPYVKMGNGKTEGD